MTRFPTSLVDFGDEGETSTSELAHRPGERGYSTPSNLEARWRDMADRVAVGYVPIAAFPGGLWRGVVHMDAREDWLKFERVQIDGLLSLPQQFTDADWWCWYLRRRSARWRRGVEPKRLQTLSTR